MKRRCNNKNLLLRGGTSQAQRQPASLRPDYVQIDEHSYADLLLFARNFSEHLTYYNLKEQKDGTWSPFFSQDISILLSFIANQDIREFDAAFDALVKALNLEIHQLYGAANLNGANLTAAAKTNLPSHLPSFKKLFDFIFSLAQLLDKQVKLLPGSTGLKAFASASIQQECSTPFYNLLGYYKLALEGRDGAGNEYKLIDAGQTTSSHSSSLLPQKFTQNTINQGLYSDWIEDAETLSDAYNNLQASDFTFAFGTNAPDTLTTPEDLEKWLKPAIKAVQEVYRSLSQVFYKIIAESPRYLEKTMMQWPNHTPHIALYLSFLKLFRFAQTDLNALKEKHLHYYYSKVLHLQKRPARADEVFAILELAKRTEQFLLEKETLFNAGKDSIGKELFYENITDTALNKASVIQLKSSYKNGQTGTIYQAKIANSADGKGAELSTSDKHWKPFGPITSFIENDKKFKVPALLDADENILKNSLDIMSEVGFAIASPNLFLQGGTRTIHIKLMIKYDAGVVINPAAWRTDSFKLFFTSTEKWLEKSLSVSPTFQKNELTFTCEIAADEAPIFPYSQKIHQGNFQTDAPLVKVIARTGAAYRELRKLELQQVGTTVEVSGLKNFTLQNDTGVLDLSAPILPFGGLAKVGSSFIFGSKEIFQKQLDKALSLNMTWKGLENKTTMFPPPANVVCTAAQLSINSWQSATTFKNLIPANLTPTREEVFDFSNENAVKNLLANSSGSRLSFSILSSNENKKFDYKPDEAYTSVTADGFIKVTLKSSFGQKEYQRELPKALIGLSKQDNQTAGVNSNFVSSDEIAIPDPPYVPTFEDLSLDYQASAAFSVTNNFSNRTEQFFHLHEFGNRERHSSLIDGAPVSLVAPFAQKGELLLGLENLEPQQSVSILFQMAEGSANPLKEKQEVLWYYLYENNWIPFAINQRANLNDQTNGFLQSGLITFFLPKKINTDNTWLDTGLIWLRAAVVKDTDAICDLIDIKTQAVRLRFKNQENATDALQNPLAAKKISKLVDTNAKIKKIEQPYTSFAGVPVETEAHFNTRISERLRHKNRAITIWDQEHLILENFPEIYRVKCLNHAQMQTEADSSQNYLNEISPGNVVLVPLPDLKNRNAVAALKPYTSLATLSKIKDFVQKRVSPHAHIEVINPLFEEVELNFRVAFREDRDFTLQSKILQQDIIRFLSPWAYPSEQQVEPTFGGRLYKSVILDFIEELSYVDFVTDFQLHHYLSPTDIIADSSEIIASTPRSVLVSKTQHIIQEINNECL